MTAKATDFKTLVYIVWVDAHSDSTVGWKSIDQVIGKAAIDRVETVGFIINETEESIAVVGSKTGELCDGDVCIPKAWIEHMEVLSYEQKGSG